MAKITKAVVDKLKPGGRDAFAWDGDIRGFGVRCRPTDVKTYLLKTTIGGRVRWLRIGQHGSLWTPDEARKEALRLLREIAKGNDPAAERRRHLTPCEAEILCVASGHLFGRHRWRLRHLIASVRRQGGAPGFHADRASSDRGQHH